MMLLISLSPAIVLGATWYGLLRRFARKPKHDPGKQPKMTSTPELPELPPPSEPSNMTETLLSTIPTITLDPETIKCACGLVLPGRIMLEHAQSTGHSGISASVPIRVGKIWDLQEAVVESASPECSKCGKPVQGLKRVGKTIYVSHAGCQDQHNKNEARGNQETLKPDDTHASSGRRHRRRANCPICWKPISGRKHITQVPSATGGRIRFHEKCLN